MSVHVVNEGTNSTVFPTSTTTDLIDSQVWGLPTCACDYHHYHLTGITPDSNEFSMLDPNNPITVSTSDSFSLQYSEGCCGTSTFDNHGTSCADVYFYYVSSDGMIFSYYHLSSHTK